MFKIVFNSPVPIYEQIANEIKKEIESGSIKLGDPLPTIRGLASQLDIAVNTVARAYLELEKAGLIESSGRKGSFVKMASPVNDEELKKAFKKPILQLLQSGMTREQIENLFKESLKLFFE